MPVLQDPTGEEEGPGGLQNLLKEEEKEEDEEEKKEDDDDEEEIEGKGRDEEDIQDSLVVEEGMIVKFTLFPFATCHLQALSSYHIPTTVICLNLLACH